MGRFVPLQLVQKFDLIPKEVATNAIRRSLHAFPGGLPQEWAEYLARDMRTFKLAELNARWMETAAIRNGATHAASALADFLDFQSVVVPTGMAFKQDPACPAGLDGLYRWGAQQLHEFGSGQSIGLATAASQVLRWCRSQGHARIVVVDSPLGGTIPAQVIARLLQSNGVTAEVREFLAPRLDRHARRYSLKEAGAEFCKSLPSGDYPVVFPDEVLTGTRFRKLFRALSKHLKHRVVPVALSVRSWAGTSYDSAKVRKLKAELAELKCAKQGAPVFAYLREVALVKVDEGAPITLSAPFFWAEMDLAAGKRKVNLVFSLIEQIKSITRSLEDKDGAAIHRLELMWSQASNGLLITQVEPFLRQIVPPLVAQVNWTAIEEAARDDFKAEYMGAAPPTDLEGVAQRLNWVLKSIYDQLVPLCLQEPNGASGAGLVTNALHDLYALGHGGRRDPLPRDRDFCECTIPAVYPDLAFHEELVARVLVQAPVP